MMIYWIMNLLLWNGPEINVIYLSYTDYSLLEEEEVSQHALGPQDVVFKKSAESRDHLKPLYIHGHLDGTSVAHMLVDGGATVNVITYSTFKKLGKTVAELIKMNMMITGIEGNEPIDPKGIALMELTVGSKTIPTAFFITEIQGN
jgi:predicted aspartyl protease